MRGLPATGSISLGTALVAGSILVPKPAAGMTAFAILLPLCHSKTPIEEMREENFGRTELCREIGSWSFILLSETARIPSSSQRFWVSDGKPGGAKSSPERIRCAELWGRD